MEHIALFTAATIGLMVIRKAKISVAPHVTARMCLMITATALVSSAFLCLMPLVMIGPQYALIGIFILSAIYGRGVTLSGWTFGTARWCDVFDLLRVGALDGKDGLFVGKIEPPGLRRALTTAFTAPWWASRSACNIVLAARGQRALYVTLKRGINRLFVGGVGSGKTKSLILPYLYTCKHGVLALDPKCELALLSAVFRQKRLGHKIVLLNPMLIEGLPSECFNCLDLLNKNSLTVLDDCHAIANDIVVRNPSAHEPHWDDSAALFIAAVIALMLTGEPESCNLPMAAAILGNREFLARAIKAMRESKAFDGMLARMGDQLANFQDKELNSVLTTVARHFRFLSSPAMNNHLLRSTFDPHSLTSDGVTTYVCLPPRQAHQSRRLLTAHGGDGPASNRQGWDSTQRGISLHA